MKNSIVFLLGMLLVNICNAGTANLYQGSFGNVNSQANFMVCGSQIHSFFVKYTFSSHNSCWANRYKVTFKLYKNGVEINNANISVSSTFANQGFYNFTVGPGSYSAKVILERRPCAGAWYTAETLSTNIINVSSIANPNFKINNIIATESNVPILYFNNGEIITIDASTTTCATNYWVGIWETGTNWWERTYDYEWGQWFPGSGSANINLQQLATNASNYSLFHGNIARKGQILFGGTINAISLAPNETAHLPGQLALIGQPRRYAVEVCTLEPTWKCKKIQIVIN
jgi:hypothetical protein